MWYFILNLERISDGKISHLGAEGHTKLKQDMIYSSLMNSNNHS